MTNEPMQMSRGQKLAAYAATSVAGLTVNLEMLATQHSAAARIAGIGIGSAVALVGLLGSKNTQKDLALDRFERAQSIKDRTGVAPAGDRFRRTERSDDYRIASDGKTSTHAFVGNAGPTMLGYYDR